MTVSTSDTDDDGGGDDDGDGDDDVKAEIVMSLHRNTQKTWPQQYRHDGNNQCLRLTGSGFCTTFRRFSKQIRFFCFYIKLIRRERKGFKWACCS